MDLQDTFYVMGIVYMSIMFILMIVVVVAILVIKHKIHMLQRNVEEKLSSLINAVHIGEAIAEKVKDTFGKTKK